MIRIRREIQEINDNVERNQELQKLRQSKDQLEKANEAMNKQTDLLEKKMEIISNENVETKRHTAAKQAEVDNLRKAYEDEHRDHDLKMKKLHEEYKMLYDKYHSILNEITEQKERATQHKSIKEELEEMRRLLNMKRLSMRGAARSAEAASSRCTPAARSFGAGVIARSTAFYCPSRARAAPSHGLDHHPRGRVTSRACSNLVRWP